MKETDTLLITAVAGEYVNRLLNNLDATKNPGSKRKNKRQRKR